MSTAAKVSNECYCCNRTLTEDDAHVCAQCESYFCEDCVFTCPMCESTDQYCNCCLEGHMREDLEDKLSLVNTMDEEHYHKHH